MFQCIKCGVIYDDSVFHNCVIKSEPVSQYDKGELEVNIEGIKKFDPLKDESKGIKHDKDKTRAGLVVGDFGLALLEVSEVGTFGEQKYSAKNWLLVKDAMQRYHDAAFRHLLSMETEENDPETGLPHIAHATWNLLACIELRKRAEKPKKQ